MATNVRERKKAYAGTPTRLLRKVQSGWPLSRGLSGTGSQYALSCGWRRRLSRGYDGVLAEQGDPVPRGL